MLHSACPALCLVSAVKKLPLCVSGGYSCNYLPGQEARSLFVHPSMPMTVGLYAMLLEQGFRRSGNEVYKPYCHHCSACIPLRLDVAEFRANRSQKRCWQKNLATQVVVKPPLFEAAHYDLYLRYQTARHAGGDMAVASPEEYLGFLSSSWCETRFVEFFNDGHLMAVAAVDQLGGAWSAVYTFFDPGFSAYSPGVYAVLWQIEQAKLSGQAFLYLGFWISACQKMAYKSHYQPAQIISGNQWVGLENPA